MTAAAAPFAATPPEEDYIDMELTNSIESSPPPARDFEFQIQMTSFSDETEGKHSPADELFYNGKLLPLHHPPRLKMVEKLISQTPSTNQDYFSQNFQIPKISIKALPHKSCKFSLTEPCRPSCELNPDEFLLGIKGFEKSPQRKSWSKQVKQLKKSFKALFLKSACLNEETEAVFENRGISEKFINVSKAEEFNGGVLNLSNHRKSFSSINNKSCCSSNRVSDLQLFKRRSVSSNSEIESSIEGAIAYCKQSQKLFVKSRENEASKVVAFGDKKSSELCRI